MFDRVPFARPAALALLPVLALISMASNAPTARSESPRYHILKEMRVGGEGGWDDLTVDAAARRVYVSRGTHVVVVDADSLDVVGDIPNTPGVHCIAIVPKQSRGYISCGGDNSVCVFDLKTLKEVSRINVGKRPDSIMFDPATQRVVTFNAGSSDATAIEVADGKVAGSVALGGKPEFAVSDGKGGIYVNIEDKSEVVEFDAKSLVIRRRISLAPGEDPTGLAIDHLKGLLFAACGNQKMVIVDMRSGKVVATPVIGKGPDGAAFDPRAHLAFTSNGQDGTITVVREEGGGRFAVAETVTTRPGARTMSLDSKTGHLILIAAQPRPPAPGDMNARRRGFEPGSFEVIVVGK